MITKNQILKEIPKGRKVNMQLVNELEKLSSEYESVSEEMYEFYLNNVKEKILICGLVKYVFKAKDYPCYMDLLKREKELNRLCIRLRNKLGMRTAIAGQKNGYSYENDQDGIELARSVLYEED